MMKAAILLGLFLLTTGAHAQTRASTLSMTCQAGRQLVFTRGAVVLGTGGNTYDRFVRDRSFCDVTEYAQTAYVPSLETSRCFIGYRCRQGPREWFED